MNKFLKSSVEIFNGIKLESNKIALIFEFENISNGIINDLYFRFNINKYGIFEKIVLFRKSKYLNCTKSNIHISSMYKNEKISFGVILDLKNVLENIYRVETDIDFKIGLDKKEHFKGIKYIKKDFNNLEKENMITIFNSKQEINSEVMINYEILFVNNTDEDIENVKIYLSIPDNTEYIKNSLIISQFRYTDFKEVIYINKLKQNECIYIQYSIKVINKNFNDKIVNNIKVLFKDIDKRELYINKL